MTATTLRPPPQRLGIAQWSCRTLALHLDLPEATVARVWREHGVTPRGNGTFEFRTRPGIAAGRVGIIGVYHAPEVRSVAMILDPPRAIRPHPRYTHRVSAGTRADREEFLTAIADSSQGHNIHVVADSAEAGRLISWTVVIRWSAALPYRC